MANFDALDAKGELVPVPRYGKATTGAVTELPLGNVVYFELATQADINYKDKGDNNLYPQAWTLAAGRPEQPPTEAVKLILSTGTVVRYSRVSKIS
jgi:hypothetical protein